MSKLQRALAVTWAVNLLLIPTGCTQKEVQAVEGGIEQVILDAIQSGTVIDAAQQAVNIFFAQAPNPDLQAKLDGLINACRVADAKILQYGNDAKKSEPEIEAANADFKKAWNDLKSELTSLGVLGPSGRFAKSAGSELPEPLLMRDPG